VVVIASWQVVVVDGTAIDTIQKATTTLRLAK
jgi:hypothetical protein